MSEEDCRESSRAGRTSPARRTASYLGLGILAMLPLLLSYLPGVSAIFHGQLLLGELNLGGVTVAVIFDARLIPPFLSTVIGVGGGFVLWCYYTRTPCFEEQVPGSALLGGARVQGGRRRVSRRD